ncbi:peamaclein [Phtheirospermum japonicum]|uniref:Peamaclein n=1 Tax=Phtheirospermum japonicum TaxID=374723 RepID=A0A830BSH7_9LAMI|nr:peamaclein [Phtheirospermum japonicum]
MNRVLIATRNVTAGAPRPGDKTGALSTVGYVASSAVVSRPGRTVIRTSALVIVT